MQPYRRETARPFSHDTTPECIDAFDELVVDAIGGDLDALGSLANGCEHFLLPEIQRELGDFYDQGAPLVLLAFFQALSEGRLKPAPGRGATFFWMKQTVRKFAKVLLKRRQRALALEWLDERIRENASRLGQTSMAGL